VGLPEAISTTISRDYNNAIMASSPTREIASELKKLRLEKSVSKEIDFTTSEKM